MASNAETGETRIPSIPDTYSDHEPSENWARELAISLQPPPFATDPFCFRSATGSVGRRNQGEGHLGGSISGEARRKRSFLCFIWLAFVDIRGNERRRVSKCGFRGGNS